mgnify:CR=1 FL=1
MWPHTLDEMSTIILIFCRDGANKIELIEKCYLNDIVFKNPPSPFHINFQTGCDITYDRSHLFSAILHDYPVR